MKRFNWRRLVEYIMFAFCGGLLVMYQVTFDEWTWLFTALFAFAAWCFANFNIGPDGE